MHARQVGVHQELVGLVAAVGEDIFGEPDSFRAALDDFLADDMATRGEVNLLVDAVRLGAFRRLLDQLDNGADPDRAVGVSGEQLARDRGTTEARSAQWAIAALGYAVGRVSEDEVLARRSAIALDRPPEARSVEPLSPAPQLGVADPVAAPTTVIVADAEPSTGTAPTPDVPTPDVPGHRGRVLAAVVAVLLVLAAAGVLARAAAGDEDPRPADARRSSDGAESVAAFTPLEVAGGRSQEKGVRMERTYRLSGEQVTSVVELTNVTKKPVTWLGAEVVPKELAEHVANVTFSPRFTGVIDADPVVYWRIRVSAGQTKRIRWTTAVPDGATPGEELLGRVIGWHEEAITRETPRIVRQLEELAREGDRIDKPDQPEAAVFDEDAPLPEIPALTPDADPDAGTSGGGSGGAGGSGSSGGDDQPATPVNHAPRLSLAPKSTSERVSAGYTVDASDPDGDSWSVVSVSGAPTGIGRSGARTLGGTVSHTAASVTTHRSSIRARSFSVRVTVQDSHGARTSGSFTWTVRDTHLTMPSYIGKYGNSPDIGSLFVPNFVGCLDTGRTEDTIARQSVSAGTPIAWGASPRFTYVYHSGDYPPC